MRLALALLTAATLFAQSGTEAPKASSPLLTNSGAAMTVPFACAEDDIQWAGLSCSVEEPCPVFLDLSNVASLGRKIFLTGNFHSAETTLYSLILASEDGGATWTEPVARIRGGELDRIQFIDFEVGWISGSMLHPLPSDAFFLVTTDGGKSWRQKPLLEDGGAGTIQTFWFASRKNGAALLDKGGTGLRYELYESPNGGESWMIRETGEKPIKLPGRPPASDESGWRLSADAKSKTFHVQKQEGDSWKSVAAFRVNAGECKPAVRPDAPPPLNTEAPPPPSTPDAVSEIQLGTPKTNARKKKPK